MLTGYFATVGSFIRPWQAGQASGAKPALGARQTFTTDS